METKRAKRFCPAEVVLVGFLGAGTRFTGNLVNISSSGALLRCAEEVALGSIGRMGFQVGSETVRIVAAVRRSVPGIGLAFQFVNMSSRDRALLHRLLRQLGAGELA